MAVDDIQWKYNNNDIVEGNYVKGKVTTEEGTQPDDKFYVLTVPSGAIILGVVATCNCTNYDDENPLKFDVEIGVNDCKVRDVHGEVVNGTPFCSKECLVVDNDKLVSVKFPEGLSGDFTLLVNFINVDKREGAVDPIKLDTKTVMIDHCKSE